jgi:pimeloyl-ACP methyl ester carboxylesterase/predicted glycosyltransferase
VRALEPAAVGQVVRDGVRIGYEVFGDGHAALLFMPSWSIVHSRVWKGQVAHFARHHRVITFDGRGNGRSDRPRGAAAYTADHYVADALAVLDATATRRAAIVGLSAGAHWSALFASRHPERTLGAVLIAPSVPFGAASNRRWLPAFERELETYEGLDKFNAHYWRRDYRGFAEFFFARCFPEPHSTKQIEDAIGWALETDADTLVDTARARAIVGDELEPVYRALRVPALLLQGSDDCIVPPSQGRMIADLIDAPLVALEGSGHIPVARDPVAVNRLIESFVDTQVHAKLPSRTVSRGVARRRRALYLSSPIGLGHARRDLAIARELRTLRADLEVDWLTQHPVTRFLADAGERIHPASAALASESRHIELEVHGHDLDVFQALRDMDEILVANFMRFQEIVEHDRYDLVIADESWDVDHFWHEHPELKRAPLAWFTDFVGYMPMAEGGDREELLTTDYNAEMIEHIERHPRVRDRSIYVGEAADIVPGTFGRGLPSIREWTGRHYDFCGYITGREAIDPARREAWRREFGFADGEIVCIATVGGSSVGADLLRRIIEAAPAVRRKLPALRMIAVAGPRIDPASLPHLPGVEVRGYVQNLDRQLAACDMALVQGGLTTCMELTAGNVPFVYFPIGHHFEQNVHVKHRLARHRAGRCMSYAHATPDEIAEAVVAELRATRSYLPVPADGAARAATLLAELI